MTQIDNLLYSVSKPARYTGGEWNSIVKDWDQTAIKVVLAYPDVYEIGMSNMALPIFYDLLNRREDVLAERAYAPWTDMAAVLRKAGVPLFSLETKHPLKEFDIIGFSLGYELTYTNVLNMLDLAQIPVLAAERDDSNPLIIAGGSCALNPEPMSDFIDLFVIGDGEEIIQELLEVFRRFKKAGKSKQELLREAAGISGIYVPGLYMVEYNPDGTIQSFFPTVPEANPVITRRIVNRLPPAVTKPVVPYIEVVHDRAAIEIQRGCANGCRFCQAGIIYRPVREREQTEVLQASEEILNNCGYNEISLLSLSTSDYPKIELLINKLSDQRQNISISLPSLYIDTFSIVLLELLSERKKSGLTFAPEAGSERLRASINKNVTEKRLLETAELAFERGWTNFKLYFMLGLPSETIEDVRAIITLVEKVKALGRKAKGKVPQIRINVSTFVPKAHTPFQWVAQTSELEIKARQQILWEGLHNKGVKLSWSEPEISLLEAVMSRGDRRLGKVIYGAWKNGAVFDSWNECFKYEYWDKAFKEAGVDPGFYALRERSFDEILPWSFIDVGVSTAFLKREYQRSLSSVPTYTCRTGKCNVCGLENKQPTCQQKLMLLKLKA